MKLLTVLTVLNLGMLAFSLVRPAMTSADSVPAVLRGRALEIVDEKGRVRAELKVLPPEPSGYPETVLLRLITSKGGPNIKVSTTEDGAGIVVGSDRGYTQILSRGNPPMVKLVAKDGKEHKIVP